MSDYITERAKLAIYLLRNGGEEDPVIEDVGPEDEGPYDLELWMADCHVATIHPNEGDTDFALAECIRDSGKLIQDLLTERDAALAEAAAHKAEAERLKAIECAAKNVWDDWWLGTERTGRSWGDDMEILGELLKDALAATLTAKES